MIKIATREYVKDLYACHVEGTERNKHQNEYRRIKDQFKTEVLSDINNRLETYSFVLRTFGKTTLETDLTIAEGTIPIENKGKGLQSFIKTEFALRKPSTQSGIDVLLIEEPENHLSHLNMKKLILKIRDSVDRQLFITTHSNLVSSRLDLRKCILLNSSGTAPALLNALPESTAEFFMKAPDNYILEFALSKKVILVEGDAEFILIEAFCEKAIGTKLEESDIHIISVDGTSFKRYLDLAKILNVKTAVLRDNDGNYQQKHMDVRRPSQFPIVTRRAWSWTRNVNNRQ